MQARVLVTTICHPCHHGQQDTSRRRRTSARTWWVLNIYISTGCPISKVPLCFGCFLGFWSTFRGTSDLYSTALEICYIIATRILKIDSEIAEIIEVKDGTCETKIIFFDSV